MAGTKNMFFQGKNYISKFFASARSCNAKENLVIILVNEIYEAFSPIMS